MSSDRKKDLAKIHIGAKSLGMDRDSYECMLWTIARVCSAGDLDDSGRQRVLDHLRARGFKPKRARRPRPAPDREALIAKVRAQLISCGNLPDSYADGMAKKMFGIQRFEWLPPAQLHKLVAALGYHQKRHGAETR